MLYPSNIFTAVRACTGTSRGIFFCFLGFVQPRNKHVVPYDTQRSFCRFLGHSTQTDCRSCGVDPKMHHPAKRSLAMCEHTGGVLRDFIVVIHRDICREHSLIGRRNYLMTEAASSLSAAADPELSTTSNPIAIIASDSATAGLAWVRIFVLWRPGASVRRTQAER